MSLPAEGLTVTTAELQERIDAVRAAPAWRNYEHVRERVLHIKNLEVERLQAGGQPSDYWREELAGFEYMFDASPLIIEKLRHHSYHVTGLKPYDYRTLKDKYRGQLRAKFEALVETGGGDDLFVPEPRELGGFGFEIDGSLMNLDTLKYFEVLLALDRGAVLDEGRGHAERRVVWEIGSGWGGLAHAFKTKQQNVTYVMSDLPELYLFSGTYLMTLFPEATFRFYGEAPDDELVEGLDGVDFLFLPHTRLDLVPRPDLTLNTVSFQEMTTDQVEGYIRRAHELGCPYLYSLNRDRSLYNPDLLGVSELLNRYYWPHEIEVLPVSYVYMMDRVRSMPRAQRAKLRAKALAAGKQLAGKESMDYRHTVGWRRISL